ncbi:MAG TPA: hypothetical protein VGJ21_23545 [Terracidiphilus sp.]|jgi:hypothetical protein
MQRRSDESRFAQDVAKWPSRARAVTCLLALISASAPCNFSQTQAPSPPTNLTQPKQSILNPEANRPPDKNAQMEMQERTAKKASYEAANTERKRQLTDDSAALLALSNELKDELDKSSKDTLSLDVVRKAEEIARLAHNVQVKMKLNVNAAY